MAKVMMTTRLDETLADRVDEWAAQYRMTRSDAMRTLLARGLAEEILSARRRREEAAMIQRRIKTYDN